MPWIQWTGSHLLTQVILCFNTISKLRSKSFGEKEKGVPLEYFEWERVFVDEIHESLCASKDELKEASEKAKKDKNSGFFKEKNRRAGREVSVLHHCFAIFADWHLALTCIFNF